MESKKTLNSCPFCGQEMDIDDRDTLYKNARYWRNSDLIPELKEYVRHKDRKESDNPCYDIFCAGCFVTMSGDTEEDVIKAWNKRVKI